MVDRAPPLPYRQRRHRCPSGRSRSAGNASPATDAAGHNRIRHPEGVRGVGIVVISSRLHAVAAAPRPIAVGVVLAPRRIAAERLQRDPVAVEERVIGLALINLLSVATDVLRHEQREAIGLDGLLAADVLDVDTAANRRSRLGIRSLGHGHAHDDVEHDDSDQQLLDAHCDVSSWR